LGSRLDEVLNLAKHFSMSAEKLRHSEILTLLLMA
jgi:hypothetical protein